MANTTDNYWVQWRSYNSKERGYCTHAVEYDANDNRALCGVIADDGAGQTLTDTNGHIGCRRCKKALAKRGVITLA
ncbi:hypothetical protein SAMN05216576_107153 [Ectopseudomonas chengduensis]|jgi:hypothetical protein|uniref:Uncharacterized protein n=2 Tax=Ectopseudomonas TaxID=3236654 RepID=A0A1G6PY44_9GAMM|nr:hypothetical protein DW68_024515 [Pseudomonas mendocina S5.2]KER98100.1 hypothetical protein HN51_25205 [Pseudomonas mendocina]SDC85019.1 hypothetical protein SAMN05216576_107153 [Pseudomonas chengduensis]